MTKQQKENLLTYCLVVGIAFLFQTTYVKWQVTHVEMNGARFDSVGMLEYTKSKDGKTLYIPLYARAK